MHIDLRIGIDEAALTAEASRAAKNACSSRISSYFKHDKSGIGDMVVNKEVDDFMSSPEMFELIQKTVKDSLVREITKAAEDATRHHARKLVFKEAEVMTAVYSVGAGGGVADVNAAVMGSAGPGGGNVTR